MKVAIVMGSDSDWPVMKEAKKICDEFQVPCFAQVLSAHRTPQDMLDFAATAADNQISIIIAGAGGAAHLPGMLAANCSLPVIGVPIQLSSLEGLDSLLSIVQMPKGVPVATVAINNAQNAGLLAIRMLALGNPALMTKMNEYRQQMAISSREKTSKLNW